MKWFDISIQIDFDKVDRPQLLLSRLQHSTPVSDRSQILRQKQAAQYRQTCSQSQSTVASPQSRYEYASSIWAIPASVLIALLFAC